MTLTARRLGVRFIEPLELQGWKVLAIDDSVPQATALSCPADDAAMRTLCTFVDGTARTRIRLGCCPRCGHVSYIDRPTVDWMNRYYLESWDAEDAEARAAKRQHKLASTRKREKTVVALAKALPVDRNRPVCEIGTGWGVSLRHLKEAGFERLVGTEPSQHRASVVRNGLGVPVFTAPFESDETQRALGERGPFSILLSNHVFEHTYDPGRVFAAAARLQRPGDYLLVAVPNQETEQVMSVFFFLPHLHSFTRASLAGVAARHGYAVEDDSHVHSKQLLFVFRRVEPMPVEKMSYEDVFGRTLQRYTEELSLDRSYFGLRRIWWLRRGGATGQRWMAGRGSFEKARWTRWVERHGYDAPRAVAVKGLCRRVTTFEESPFEFRFGGPIGLFYK